MCLHTKNAKMANTTVEQGILFASFSLPAGGEFCINAGACKEICYAERGNYQYSSVQLGAERTAELVKGSRFHMIAVVERELERLSRKALRDGLSGVRVRIHDSGDFHTKAYADRWILLAKRNPQIIFYCYTKSWEFFVGRDLPPNFRFTQSMGSTKDHTADPRYPMAFVRPRGTPCPEGFIEASHSDYPASEARGAIRFSIAEH
jgi:hypothetical protein